MIDRAHVPPVVTTTGAAIALAGTFLPWLRSGTVDRSSYEIFDLVERLGFSTSGAIAWTLRLWPLVPLLLVLSAVAHWMRPAGVLLRRSLAALPVVTAIVVGGTAFAVLMAPDVALFQIRVGPWVTLAGASAMVVGVCCVPGRPRRSRVPPPEAATSDVDQNH